MKLGEKLRIVRKKLNLNQAQFAEKLELGERTYQSYENDESSLKLKTIEKLINEYNINPNWLFTNKGNIFSGQESENFKSPEQFLEEAYDLTQFEVELVKNEFFNSPSMKKAILKLLRAKSKEKEALDNINDIIKELKASD